MEMEKWDVLKEVKLGRKTCQSYKNEESIREIYTSFKKKKKKELEKLRKDSQNK